MVTLDEGSYEEYPPTPIDFAIRDRRWCQGNPQHLKLLASRRMHWVSRLHLLMGAFAYLTSPHWALLIGVRLVQAGIAGGGERSAALDPMSAWRLRPNTALLFGLNMMSPASTMLDRALRGASGGAG